MCSCATKVVECEFWKRIADVIRKNEGVEDPLVELNVMLSSSSRRGSFREYLEKAALIYLPPWVFRKFSKLFLRSQLAVIENSGKFYSAASQTNGTRFVVDGTKDVRRMKWLSNVYSDATKVIFMKRDGRAVAASEMRRDSTCMTTAAGHWARYTTNLLRAMETIHDSRKLDLEYELLCSDPSRALQKVAAFLDIPAFESTALDKNSSHAIHGNQMRWRRDEKEIVFDERWRRELTESDLMEFEAIAGNLNSRLGYAST